MDILWLTTTKCFWKRSFIHGRCHYSRFVSLTGKTTTGDTETNKYAPKGTSKAFQKCAPIIALHDVLGSKKSMDCISGDLAISSGHPVISLDCRNHGNSPHSPVQDYHWMAGDLNTYIKTKVRTRDAMIIGQGMGGKAAIYMALAQPNAVRNLVVVDATPFTDASLEEKEKYTRVLDAMDAITFKAQDVTTGISEAKQHIMHKTGLADDEYLMKFVLSNVVKKPNNSIGWLCNINAIKANIDAILGFKFDKYITGKKNLGPTLFVAGEHSTKVTKDEFKKIIAIFPKARMCLIKGARDNVLEDSPHILVKIVCSFYNSSDQIKD